MKNKLLENISFIIIAVTLVLISVFNENGKAMIYIASEGLISYGTISCIFPIFFSWSDFPCILTFPNFFISFYFYFSVCIFAI